MGTLRQPVVFLPHGGGPWPFVDVGIGSHAGLSSLATYLKALREVPPQPPLAVLMVSAHWEEPVPTVSTAKAPPMLYDYSGFPPASYQIQWPAPGDPGLAARVQHLLGRAGFKTAADTTRGFDHGCFVPMKLAWPHADIPTVQLSLVRGLDPALHLQLGRALQPLRDEGVFIVGSGMTFHNLRTFGPRAAPAATAFDQWLQDACCRPATERDQRLSTWTKAPSARDAHPREEHLIPLHVIAGAAGDDKGVVAWAGKLVGIDLSAYSFG
ncbi:MAG: dioxygenase [Deltaproteobacteria bacterium]|nr:dioxygenase [Deltaproteobacteria bacterium]